MSTRFTIVFTFVLTNFFAQDTLLCRKDLLWDQAKKYYYKKGDSAKTPYTGPAKCVPRKGYVNKGYINNGAWNGTVFGYKENQLIGFVEFKQGIYHGSEVRYTELKQTKDSTYYVDGKVKYRMTNRYKDNVIRSTWVDSYQGDTLTRQISFFKDGQLEQLSTEQICKNKRVGIWLDYEVGFDEEGNNTLLLFDTRYYSLAGKLTRRDFFDGGYLYKQEQYDEKGNLTMELLLDGEHIKIVQETPYVKGKIHGNVNYYENGKLVKVEIFLNGKLTDSKEFN